MHVLLVSPGAPPKNSPEAIQVHRFLSALNPDIRVSLVTTPIESGWQWQDQTLQLVRPGMQVITVGLPLHRFTQRIIANRRLSFFHVPDSSFWLRHAARQVLRQLESEPDVIYSRSAPFSAALLGRQLKQKLDKPWMMHLGDPWAGSPYRAMVRGNARDATLEAMCVTESDLLTLTTEGQANYYRRRYPERREQIRVSRNIMPPVGSRNDATVVGAGVSTGKIKILHIGALYGERDPEVLLMAMRSLHRRQHVGLDRLHIEFVGNMSDEVASRIDATPGCVRKEPVSYDAANRKQAAADILLAIEPKRSHELHDHFLPSKITDYLAQPRPILALTPQNSLTARYCRQGHGWTFDPEDVRGLERFLASLVDDLGTLAGRSMPDPPRELEPSQVVAGIEGQLLSLVDQSRSPGGARGR